MSAQELGCSDLHHSVNGIGLEAETVILTPCPATLGCGVTYQLFLQSNQSSPSHTNPKLVVGSPCPIRNLFSVPVSMPTRHDTHTVSISCMHSPTAAVPLTPLSQHFRSLLPPFLPAPFPSTGHRPINTDMPTWLNTQHNCVCDC